MDSAFLSTTDFPAHIFSLRFRAAPDLPISEVQTNSLHFYHNIWKFIAGLVWGN